MRYIVNPLLSDAAPSSFSQLKLHRLFEEGHLFESCTYFIFAAEGAPIVEYGAFFI